MMIWRPQFSNDTTALLYLFAVSRRAAHDISATVERARDVTERLIERRGTDAAHSMQALLLRLSVRIDVGVRDQGTCFYRRNRRGRRNRHLANRGAGSARLSI